jgi:hypothetical protein
MPQKVRSRAGASPTVQRMPSLLTNRSGEPYHQGRNDLITGHASVTSMIRGSLGSYEILRARIKASHRVSGVIHRALLLVVELYHWRALLAIHL